MSNSKKSKHIGQLPLDAVEQSLDDVIEVTERPKGMPALSVIKAEILRQGLTESDAEHMYDIWMMNGFTLKGGKKVQDWKAAIRVWKRNEYFPSQKKVARGGLLGPAVDAGWKPPTLEQVKEYAARKHWSAGFARHCYNMWLGNNWRHFGQPITSDEQWKAIMESMEYKP